MQNNDPWIGVSTLSLYPRTLSRALEIAQQLDFGIQLVPSTLWREQDLRDLKNLEDTTGRRIVMSYEGDWRMPTLLGIMQKAIQNLDPLALLAPMIFGSRTHVSRALAQVQSLFPQALGVDQGPWSLMEVSPVNSNAKEDYLEHKPGVVLDTLHAREFSELEPSGLVSSLVAAGQIKLIHFQTRSREELDAFIAGGGEDVDRLLRHALLGCNKVIIEVPPQFLGIRHPQVKLREIADAIRRCVD